MIRCILHGVQSTPAKKSEPFRATHICAVFISDKFYLLLLGWVVLVRYYCYCASACAQPMNRDTEQFVAGFSFVCVHLVNQSNRNLSS